MATKSKKTAPKKTTASKASPKKLPAKFAAGPVSVDRMSTEQIIEARDQNKTLSVPSGCKAEMEELTKMAQELAVRFTKLGAPSIICVANQEGKCTVEIAGDLYSIMQMEKTVSEAASEAVRKVKHMDPDEAAAAIKAGLDQIFKQTLGRNGGKAPNVDVQVMKGGGIGDLVKALIPGIAEDISKAMKN